MKKAFALLSNISKIKGFNVVEALGQTTTINKRGSLRCKTTRRTFIFDKVNFSKYIEGTFLSAHQLQQQGCKIQMNRYSAMITGMKFSSRWPAMFTLPLIFLSSQLKKKFFQTLTHRYRNQVKHCDYSKVCFH